MSIVRESSIWVLLGRSFWIMFGPLLLIASGLMILVNTGAGWRTRADILYLLTLLGMIIGRWIEFQGGKPQTSTGEPSTVHDFRRFALWVIVGGAGGWLAANFISNHLLPQ